jgi:hypothetical protein
MVYNEMLGVILITITFTLLLICAKCCKEEKYNNNNSSISKTPPITPFNSPKRTIEEV